MRNRVTGALATLMLLTILAGIPAVLLLTGALPRHLPTLGQASAALRAPDDGTLLLTAVTVVGWAAWAVLAAAIITELAARARGITAPRLPHGMQWAQGAARALVTAAALTFTVVGPAATSHAGPTGHTAATSVAAAAAVPGHPTTAAPTPAGARESLPATRQRAARVATVPYTVARGDSLWSIAAAHLGDGAKYRTIADLNRPLLGDRLGFLEPGWVLQVPAPPAPAPGATTVVVEPGDTLSGIAAHVLRDADRYPELAAATRAVTQPGGEHLSDPDLIKPGWRIVIPTPPPRVVDSPPAPARPEPGTRPPAPEDPHGSTNPGLDPGHPSVTETAPTRPGRPAPPTTAPSSAPRTPAPASAAAAVRGQLPSPPWLLAGLTGAGTVLAGSLFISGRRRRHAQFRARRPGRTVPPVPAELAATEASIATLGAPAAATLEILDQVLRALAYRLHQGGDPLPDLAAIELSDTSITAHLATPGPLPAPWQAVDDTDRRWSWPASSDVDPPAEDLADRPAPWPLLVTIGADPGGHLWLLNAEAYPLLQVTGPPEPVEDFVRHLVAELATSPWSRDLRIDCLNLLPELAPLNPRRLHHHDHPGPALLDAAADATAVAGRAAAVPVERLATARAHQIGEELWPARLVVARPDTTGPAMTALTSALTRDATGTTLLLCGDPTLELDDRTVLVLTGDGRLRLPGVGLQVTPVGLTRDEGTGCAALMAGRTVLDDAPMPRPSPPVAAWQEATAVDGSIRDDLTTPRRALDDSDASSLLPRPDADYLAVAATTSGDLAALAPGVPPRVRASIEAADPTLDADLATWRSERADLPRLALFGPVRARTLGDPYAVTERKGYYTEVLAWLALHPGGGTSEELSEALGISGNRVRVDIKAVRDWLGVNPRTGQLHLPDARQSAAAKARGRGVYQVDGLLLDLDLFRRLRARGQARGGTAGLEDLTAALTLVAGPPFTALREHGWGWLFGGDRIDEHMVCAIVDVAHTVTTAALLDGDLAIARAATDVAVLAAPYEDGPQLDRAAIARAEGDLSRAAAIIRDDVCNRVAEPGLPPTELPARTTTILAATHWAARAS